MESASGLPMLNCLLQHTLRTLCCSSSSDSSDHSSSKWVYAVFWRILPRNYPPPKWDYGGSLLDRSKGNKRNWILVWEDGYCDFLECERAGSGYIKGRFGADIFFKMSHEVYSYGEGLVGKVAADNSHKWVFRQNLPENKDLNLFSSWNGSIDPQPKAWETQFNSGIQTIAVISVREGLIQLGSLEKIVEDLNLVISIQRKFSYLQSIPGVFSMQRPYPSNTQMMMINDNMTSNEKRFLVDDERNLLGCKRCYGERLEESSPNKSMNFGWNTPLIACGSLMGAGSAGPFWAFQSHHLPAMACSLGTLLSKLPSVIPSHNTIEAPETALEINKNNNMNSSNCGRSQSNEGVLDQINSHVKIESCSVVDEEEKQRTQIPN